MTCYNADTRSLIVDSIIELRKCGFATHFLRRPVEFLIVRDFKQTSSSNGIIDSDWLRTVAPELDNPDYRIEWEFDCFDGECEVTLFLTKRTLLDDAAWYSRLLRLLAYVKRGVTVKTICETAPAKLI